MMVPTPTSARLFLAELQQSVGNSKAALATLAQALPDSPNGQAIDPVMLAAFGELAVEVGDRSAWHRFNLLAADLGNDTPVHTAVMFYRAKALFEQELYEAALSVLTPSAQAQERPGSGVAARPAVFKGQDLRGVEQTRASTSRL